MGRRWHAADEIAAKLRQADALMMQIGRSKDVGFFTSSDLADWYTAAGPAPAKVWTST